MTDHPLLLRSCLLLFLLGLGMIFVANVVSDVENVPVAALSESYLGQRVRIDGVVRDPAMNDGHLFFTLAEKESGADIRIVQFRAPEDIPANTSVTVTGAVDIYRGTLEIVADRIRTTP